MLKDLLAATTAAEAVSFTKPRNTIIRKGKRYDRDIWQHNAGLRSKAIQFSDPERLPDGRHAWYKKNGEMVKRKVK